MKKSLLKIFTKERDENRMKKLIIAMIVFAFVVAMNVQAVQAIPIAPANGPAQIFLSTDNVTWLPIADNSGLDTNGTQGIINYASSIGSFFVNINTGITQPIYPNTIHGVQSKSV